MDSERLGPAAGVVGAGAALHDGTHRHSRRPPQLRLRHPLTHRDGLPRRLRRIRLQEGTIAVGQWATHVHFMGFTGYCDERKF